LEKTANVTHGMFSTCVGRAAIWLSFSPKLLFTLSPVGKSWKKFGTPEATYDGMLEPNADKTELISPPTSLTTPLLNFEVFVGLHSEGEGVIIGCSAAAAAAGIGAGEHDASGKANRKKAAEVLSMMRGD